MQQLYNALSGWARVATSSAYLGSAVAIFFQQASLMITCRERQPRAPAPWLGEKFSFFSVSVAPTRHYLSAHGDPGNRWMDFLPQKPEWSDLNPTISSQSAHPTITTFGPVRTSVSGREIKDATYSTFLFRRNHPAWLRLLTILTWLCKKGISNQWLITLAAPKGHLSCYP